MPDEGSHEFQLNGKQLVFLFMAATVVAVVIFLCGVMVGRGVPARVAFPVDSPEQVNLDPTATVRASPAARTSAGGGSAPATAQEDLTYPELLRDEDLPLETLRPAVEPTADMPSPRAPPVVVVPPAPAAAPRRAAAPSPVAAPVVAAPPAPAVAAAPAASTAPLAEPPGAGFVVQVAAVRQRAEANTIARRLTTRGYPAFVTTSGANFRVRVGKYDDRTEAESVAGRLEKEERFKPWITR